MIFLAIRACSHKMNVRIFVHNFGENTCVASLCEHALSRLYYIITFPDYFFNSECEKNDENVKI